MSILFEPLGLGGVTLPNRVVMAPMTRGRATVDGVPTEAMAEYYARRSEAGLLISEAIAVSPGARGWCGAPGLYAPAQQRAWQTVTDAVRARGGRLFAQLWYVGRVSHPDFLDGALPVGPSALRARQDAYTYAGRKACVIPRVMTPVDIRRVVGEYAIAARQAIDAGFDGVQVHAANGYLPDQFLRDGSNRRRDAYGGDARARARFLCEVTEAIVNAVGAARTSVRLSPYNRYNDMCDSDPARTFGVAAELLDAFGLAFLESVEGLPGHFLHEPGEVLLPVLRAAYSGVLVANGGYDREIAEQTISCGAADAVAFGTPFIANPDLVRRLREGLPLEAPVPETFYTPGEPGYLDYPTYDEASGKVRSASALTLAQARRH